MSEQKRPYMQELDDWTDEFVITPLWNVACVPELGDRDRQAVINEVMRAVREKVLESYRNGQKAGMPKRPYGTQKQTQK